MKKLIVIVILCVLSFGTLQGQVSQKKDLQSSVIEMLTQKLELTPTQVNSVTSIMAVFAKSRKAILESNELTDELRAQKLININKREDSNIKYLLNEDQYSKFKEIVKEFRKS